MAFNIAGLTKNAGSASSGIAKKFYYAFIFFIFAVIIFNGVRLGIESNDMGVTWKYLGNKLAAPTMTVGEESQKIIDNGGFYIRETDSVFGNLWETIKTYSSLISAFFLIIIWITIISAIILFLLFDDSKKPVALIFALFAFFIIQIIYFLYIQRNPMDIIYAFINFAKAIPILIMPFYDFAEDFTGGNSTLEVVETINANITAINTTINETINNTIQNLTIPKEPVSNFIMDVS